VLKPIQALNSYDGRHIIKKYMIQLTLIDLILGLGTASTVMRNSVRNTAANMARVKIFVSLMFKFFLVELQKIKTGI